MQIQVTIDTVSPALTKMMQDLKSPALMKNLGDAAAALSQRAFREESLRPSAWAPRSPKSRGTWPLLRHHLLLERSIRVTESDAVHAVIGSDRKYAAYHQLGTRKMPARPFMPFTPSGVPTPALVTALEQRANAFAQKLASRFNSGS